MKSRIKEALGRGYNVVAFLTGIALTGFGLNFCWYLFLALVLGWGDSGPEWYIDIQEIVRYSIYLVAAMLWLGGTWWFRSKNRKKQKPTEDNFLKHSIP